MRSSLVFFRECFSLAPDQSRCPSLHKEETVSDSVGIKSDNGSHVTSYKAAVSNGRERAQWWTYRGTTLRRSETETKSIACERQGLYRHEVPSGIHVEKEIQNSITHWRSKGGFKIGSLDYTMRRGTGLIWKQRSKELQSDIFVTTRFSLTNFGLIK